MIADLHRLLRRGYARGTLAGMSDVDWAIFQERMACSDRTLAVPAIIARAGDHAADRFREFFCRKRTGPGRLVSTMCRYRAACAFFEWLERNGISELAAVRGGELSAYLRELWGTACSAAGPAQAELTVRQHRTSIQKVFDWLVEGGILGGNPVRDWVDLTGSGAIKRQNAIDIHAGTAFEQITEELSDTR
jgi:hypothetical protein